MDYDYDLFVIGAGSGGVRAARMAGAGGARVAIAEERHMGGTCVNVGCVPKKLLVYASHFSEEARDAAAYGWTVAPPRFNWPALIANKNTEIARLNGVYDSLLEKAGVTVFDGRATLDDAHTVRIGDTAVTAKTILVATGGRPTVPEFPGNEHVITSDEAFFLDDLPQRVLIVGGGYIAVEFAGIFDGMGARVTQLYRGPLFLRGFDDDVRRGLASQMLADGIDLRFDTNVASVALSGERRIATLTDGSSIEADVIMYATGRHPNTRGIGLEAAGIALDDKGAVVVDAFSKTSVDHIYAVGDCTDRVNLTPVAIAEAMAFVRTVFDDQPTAMEYDNIPSAVFSRPSIATVGLTESQARDKFGEIDVYISTFRPMKYTLPSRNMKAVMKVLVNPDDDRVVGIHMLGPDAGEIIQGLAAAMKCGITKSQLDSTIGIHPTTAEEFMTMRTKA